MTIPIKIFGSTEVENSTEEGSFKGMLATYNKEFNGCIADKGCFDKHHSVEAKIPMLYGHDTYGSVIGHMYVVATKKGLAMKGKFNLGIEAGKEKYANFKAGDFNGFSIGAYIHNGAVDPKTGIYHLTELEAYEGSYTPFPANKDAIGVSATKGGFVKISELTEEQRDILRDSLDSIVATVKMGEVPSYLLSALVVKKEEEKKEDDTLMASLQNLEQVLKAGLKSGGM